MQNHNTFLSLIAIGLLLLNGGSANAKERTISGSFSGTFATTDIDVNADGFSADLSTARMAEHGKTIRYRQFQGLADAVPTSPTAECGAGVFIIDDQSGQGYGHATETYADGDQVYNKVSHRTACAKQDGTFSIKETGVVVGGTGGFYGVTGTYESETVGFYQVFDPATFKGFGSFSGKFTEHLVLP